MIFGYSEAEALALNVEVLVPEALRTTERAGIARFVAGQDRLIDAGRPVELPAIAEGGAERVIELTFSHVEDAAVPGRFALAIIRDVTGRRRMQEELHRTSEMYRGFFENAAEGIFQTNPAGRLLTANPALARMFGYDTPESLIAGMTDVGRQLYVEPDRRVEFLRHLQEHGAVTGFESQVYRRDGSVIWIAETARGAGRARQRSLLRGHRS